jgi:hypothetical protein
MTARSVAVVTVVAFAVVTVVAGCGQTSECRAYVACQRAVDDDVDVAAWDEAGTCWQQSARVAAVCSAQCRAALDTLRGLPDAPAVCNE